jgi:alkaline phosphatase D
MTNKITRRRALLGASAALLYPVVNGKEAGSHQESEAEARKSSVFAHGVASGDPDESSVVIWTRLSGSLAPVYCRWLIAADENFSHVIRSGKQQTDRARDYTVKVLVEGLEAGKQYYYKFESAEEISPTGRTRTLPVGHVESLTIAVATCSNYPFGYFNAYEVIANDNSIDLVLHLGDYIYEYGIEGYGGQTGRRIGRSHKPTHEIISIEDYRERHAQYKSDVCSQSMHARHPMVVIWDDHESANNPWMEGAQNHQDNEGDWISRRDTSLQAYYEWMPIREPDRGHKPEEYWRHYKFGDLASIITLESRHTGRSKQITYGDHLKDLDTIEQASKLKTEVIGNPSRTMLSSPMKKFLKTEIAESVNANRSWRIIGNQSVMAKSISPKLNTPFFEQLRKNLNAASQRRLDGLKKLGALNLQSDLDAWDGYPAARENFYQIAKTAGAQDLLVVSGDSHSFWQNQLFDENDNPMGVELGATGISSPRSLLAFGDDGLKKFDDANTANNKEIVWADGRHRGFIKLVINQKSARADYIAVSTVESRHYTSKIIRSVDIVKSGGMLEFA